MNKSNIVKLTIDPKNPPVLTDDQEARLAALAALPEELIDTSDSPVYMDAVWLKAVDLPHSKKLISLRIDADVIDFFKDTGSRYQTRINSVLRSYVLANKALGDSK